MLLYLVVFAFSVCFFYYATTLDSPKQCWFLIILAILPVAFVAGVRDDCIGTDVLVYGKDVFLDALAGSKYADFDLEWMIRMEPGYLLLNFVVSRFTNDYHVFFALLMAVQMAFVMAALLRFKGKFSLWVPLLIYYLLYYNVSLNQMRQSLACAVVLYAFTFVIEKKIIPFLFFIALASSFHISAVVAVVLYPVYHYVVKRKSILFIVLLLAAGVAIALLAQNFIDMVLSFVGLDDKYAHYFKDSMHGFFITRFLIMLPIPIVYLYCWKWLKERGGVAYFIFFSLCVSVVATQARELIGNDAERMISYFSLFQIFAIPWLAEVLNGVKKKMMVAASLVYYAFYWYYMFIYNAFHETYPYTSYIINQWI